MNWRAAASGWTWCATRPSGWAARVQVRTARGHGTTLSLTVPLRMLRWRC